MAIVRYNTKEEAQNAHSKLNSIPLGNSPIMTQFISENDVKYANFFLLLKIY